MGNDKAKELFEDAKDKVEHAVHDVASDLKADAERLRGRLEHEHAVDEKLSQLVESQEGQDAKKRAEVNVAGDAVMLGQEE